MKIEFLGHSSFLISTSQGTKIITDPFDPAGYPGQLNYGVYSEPVDVVTVSHDHADHAGVKVLKGSPVVIKGEGKFAAKDAQFLGVGTYHDDARGAKRGKNTVFVISADGLRVAHMGDLGHVLTADQAAEIGNVDVILVPVGGYFTIDAAQADEVASQLDANIVIPMHYKTAKCNFPIAGVDEFLKGKTNVVRTGGSVFEIDRESLPAGRQVVVLEPAL
ncbi:MAG: MBL fold metallo-hydrolase [Armatimonadota bacterium]|nr:MBL fold metallo-hydrolase [Armatimonadota bacterium]